MAASGLRYLATRCRLGGCVMKRLGLVVGLVVFFGLNEAVSAVPIKLLFSGTVTNFSDPADFLNGSLSVLDKIFGSYTFDSLTSDGDGRTTVGSYSLISAGVVIGNQEVRNTSGGEVSIFNDIPDFNGADRYHVVWTAFAGLPKQAFDFTLFDSSGSALSSDALPLAPPNISAFPNQHSGTWRYYADNGIDVLASANITINSISTEVPEPTTLALMALGLAGLGRSIRRRNTLSKH
jgi:hypothetical protein